MEINCTEEDILNYENENMKRLKIKDLGEASGGISAKSMLMSGGIVSLVLLGAGFNSGTQSYAAVKRDDIISSTTEFKESLEGKKEDALTAGKTSTVDGKDDKSTYLVDAKSTTPKNNSNIEFEEKSDLEKEKESVAESTKPISELKYSDPVYVAEGLNLVDQLIMKETGEIDVLRFMNGNTGKITIKKENENRMYNYDEGKGSSNYMKMLFLSVDGTLGLSVTVNKSTSFVDSCKPDPEMYAGIINYWHNAVRANCVEPLDSSDQDWSEFSQSILNETSKTPSDNKEKKLTSDDILKGLKNAKKI